MKKATLYQRAGFLIALLVLTPGCTSVPLSQDCQSSNCQLPECQSPGSHSQNSLFTIFGKSDSETEENEICDTDSGSCCDQDCQPSKFFTGLAYLQGFDNLGQSKNARCCARKALECIKDNTNSDLSSDFKSGFRKAYQDIAMGRKGTTPAIPPEKYWYAYYRGSKGKERAQEWFSGYEKGVEMAKFSGIYDARQIHSSLIQQAGY